MKLHDRATLGIVSGIAAQLIKFPISMIAVSSGLAQTVDTHVAAGVFLSSERLSSTAGVVFGFFMTLLIAGLIGVSVVYALTATGKDFWWLKGPMLASGALVLFWGIVTALGGSEANANDMASNAITAVLYLLWGYLTAYFIMRWGDESLFEGIDKLS